MVGRETAKDGAAGTSGCAQQAGHLQCQAKVTPKSKVVRVALLSRRVGLLRCLGGKSVAGGVDQTGTLGRLNRRLVSDGEARWHVMVIAQSKL